MVKKLLCMALALMLLCGLVPALAQDDNVVYASDFTAGKDGWFGRSSGGTKVKELNGTLFVVQRAGDWHGPARELELQAGTEYWFYAEAMQNTTGSADFVLTLVYTKGGEETTVPLARANGSASGDWSGMCGSWVAEECDRVLLCVETGGSPMINFYIRDVRVTLNNPMQVSKVTWEGELPSLKEVYSDRFDVGTCMSGADVRNAARCELVRTQYSIITPENELKPDSVLDVAQSRKLAESDDTQVAVHFNNAKPLLDFARQNGLKVHGHVLVWHSQTPEEFFHVGYNRSNPYVSREVMLARLDNYIRLVFEYMEQNYPGLIVSWDVVNEAVADGSTALRTSNWTKVVGQDFVCRAFEIADRYAPEGVLLYYNDYSTPYEPKLSGITALLESLVSEGHIDGYGFQTHYSAGDPSVETVKKAFDRIAALGLRLRVSEMDIKVNADTDASREKQAEKYRQLMELYLSYEMEAVQVWGVCDGTSWIGANYPLPFDAALQPKPAFFAMVEAVR